MMMKALTVKQPFAWALMDGWKRVENRTWAPSKVHIGQRIAIHSSAGRGTRQDFADNCEAVYDAVGESAKRLRRVKMTDEEFGALDLLDGHVLGTMVLAEVITTEEEAKKRGLDPWFFGPFGWVLGEPVKFAQPVPMKGALGLWNFDSP